MVIIIMLVTGVVLAGGYATVKRVSGRRVAAAIEQHVFPPDAALSHIVAHRDEWLPRLKLGELHHATAQALRRCKTQELLYHRDAVLRIVPLLARDHNGRHGRRCACCVPQMGLVGGFASAENVDAYREKTLFWEGIFQELQLPFWTAGADCSQS